MANTERPPHGPRRESNNTLYFIVGALIVAVLVIGWFLYGGTEDPVEDVDVNVESSEPITEPEPIEAEPVEPEVTTPPEPELTEPAEPAIEPAEPAIEPAEPAPDAETEALDAPPAPEPAEPALPEEPVAPQ